MPGAGMPSIISVAGEHVDIAQGREWPDEEIDRLIGGLVLKLHRDGVSVPRIAARFRVHRATIYRWIAQTPEDVRRRVGAC